MRPDLEMEQQTFQGRRCWIIKDPLALKYFRFEEEEQFLLQALDGQKSAEQVIALFETRFAPQRLSSQELHQLLGQLHRSNLLISDRAGQGEQLYQRSEKSRRKLFRQQLANPLAIRFRGYDPTALLDWLEPRTRWLFSGPVFFLVILLGIAALSLVFCNFEQFQSRLPRMQEFFAGRNWLGLTIVLAFTKVLHEFGHALACRRFGGQCHEMGAMLLVFTPCLYANVTDSWMLPDKWKRITISAAGIYVELFLASLATFVWWSSQPGLVNQLALNIMFVCSTGTLLFNANPLMKYDGYYILADWLETPNLRQKSSALVANTLSRWLAGLPGRTDPFLPNRKRWIFWSYALAAAVYRVFVTVAIFWFLYRLLEPWGLKILGQILAVVAISSLLVPPMRQAYRFLSTPGRWTTVNRPRLAIASGIVCLLISLLLFLPLPHDVRCSFYLQPAGARDVFVEQPGIVTEILARPGEQVAAGQPLLRLVNLELQAELVRVRKELAAAEAQLRLAQTWGSSDESISAQVPAARAAYEAAATQVARLQTEVERLTVVAPVAGTLLPAQRRPSQNPHEMRLVKWDGQPLQTGRTGCYLEPQTKLGSITNTPGNYEAVLLVSQEDSEWITANQTVKLWIRELPSQVIRASTSNLSVQPVANIPRPLATRHGGEIPTESDSQNEEVPLTPTYQVAASFSSTQQLALSGATGLGAIRVGYRTPASRLWRWFLKTFHFEL